MSISLLLPGGAHSTQIKQSMPDSGLGLSHFQGKVFKIMQGVPFSLGSGPASVTVM